MKHLELTEDEQRTLREMGVFHPHPRTRMRAQGILRLNQGLTLQKTADEFGVHLNSVEQWRQWWNKLGLAGLYEGRHTGRPRKWTPQQQKAFGELAVSEGGTVSALLRQIAQSQDQVPISENTAKPTSQVSVPIRRCSTGGGKSARPEPLNRSRIDSA
jgi:transposase